MSEITEVFEHADYSYSELKEECKKRGIACKRVGVNIQLSVGDSNFTYYGDYYGLQDAYGDVVTGAIVNDEFDTKKEENV